MGTNYYHLEKACSECGRGCELHIGKSSVGWPFIFRAYPDLESKAKWERRLREGESAGAVIRDEYEVVVPLERLISLVALSQDYRKNDDAEHADDYLDEEGYVFTDSEFS